MPPSPTSSPSVPNLPAPDHDLEALPAPRRPWRRLTLAALALSALGSGLLCYELRGEASFALHGGAPVDLGELSRFRGSGAAANSWVRGSGELRVDGAVRYSRPLERDSYRLARVAGNDKLWVQVSVPMDDADPEARHFVPPVSFVGRLLPVSRAGMRFGTVRAAVADAWQGSLPDDAWLLIDGEAPPTTRWSLGLCGLFVGFAVFSVFGLVRLTQRVG